MSLTHLNYFSFSDAELSVVSCNEVIRNIYATQFGLTWAENTKGVKNAKHRHDIEFYFCELVCTVSFVGAEVMVSTWWRSTQKEEMVLLCSSSFSLFSPNCLSALSVWCEGLPGWVQVVPAFSLVPWVQALQSPQVPASRRRTPECMLGCPRHLRAIWCW